MQPQQSPGAGLVVHTIISGMFGQNSYVLEDPAHGSAVVIDPGFGCAEGVGALLAASRARLDLILLTHEHFDHIGNLNEIRAANGGQVVASASCSAHLTDPKKNLSAFHGGLCYSAAPADLVVEEMGSTLTWGEHEIRIHGTPGHSDGSICIEIKGRLFTGDTLIKDTKTVVKLPGGSKAKLSRTLDFIFSTFPPDTLIYPGHGKTLPLGATRKTIHL